MNISTSEKQEILEEFDIHSRLEKALVLINREIQRIELGERIQADVQDEISKTQKEYLVLRYLQELDLNEIAKVKGVTRQAVSDGLKRAISFLQEGLNIK